MRLGRPKQESAARGATVVEAAVDFKSRLPQCRGNLGFVRKEARQAPIHDRAASKYDNGWDRTIQAAPGSGLESPCSHERKLNLARMVFKVLSSIRLSPVARGFCRERTRVEPIWLKHNLYH